MATLDVVHVSRGVAGLRVTVFGEQVDGHLSRSGLDLGVTPRSKRQEASEESYGGVQSVPR